jgi:hypothetical protein
MNWLEDAVAPGTLLKSRYGSAVRESDGGWTFAVLEAGEPVLTLSEQSFSERNGFVIKVLTRAGVGFVCATFLDVC